MSDKTKLGIALSFLAGLAIGWFVFGWWLFPVHWKNVDPWELRATAKANYLDFVAEDYAAHHDMNRVRNFLMGWPSDDLSKFLTELTIYHQKKGEAALARDVYALKQALGPETMAPPQSKWKHLLVLIIEILALSLILVGILYAVWRYFFKKEDSGSELLSSSGAKPEKKIAEPSVVPTSGAQIVVEDERPIEEPQPVEEPAVERTPEAPATTAEPEATIILEPTKAEGEEPTPGAVEEAPSEPEEPTEEQAPVPGAVPFPPLPGEWELLKRSVLEFKFGEDPNYTDSQDLMVDGEYIGNCGLGPEEWLDDDQEQPWIFTVWLFDKQDINTQQAMVLSPAAWEDEAIKSRLREEKEDIELVEAVPGATFTLETKGLRLDGEVESVQFSPLGDGRSVITHLKIRTDVYRNPEAGTPAFLN